MDIDILDRNLCDTRDTIQGSPMVPIYLKIGSIEVIPGLFALVDTGADYTVVSTAMIVEFRPQIQAVDKTTIADPILKSATENIFEAEIEISGLYDPVTLYVIEKPIPRHPLLIGRNLLVRYRFIYDPTAQEYTLTKP